MKLSFVLLVLALAL